MGNGARFAHAFAAQTARAIAHNRVSSPTMPMLLVAPCRQEQPVENGESERNGENGRNGRLGLAPAVARLRQLLLEQLAGDDVAQDLGRTAADGEHADVPRHAFERQLAAVTAGAEEL